MRVIFYTINFIPHTSGGEPQAKAFFSHISHSEEKGSCSQTVYSSENPMFFLQFQRKKGGGVIQ